MTQINDNNPSSINKISRPRLLEISSWLVDDLRTRLDVDRFREREGDSTKLQYLRVFVQAVQAHNSILKEEDLDDIKTRIELLEASQERVKK